MRIIDFLIFSNIFVAMPVALLAWETQLRFAEDNDPMLVLFIYCSTLFLYCFHRIFRLSSADESMLSTRHLWALDHMNLMKGITAVAALLSCLFFTQLRMAQWLVVVPTAFVSLAYTIPLPCTVKRLRDMPMIKIFLIALSVSFTTVFLPLAGNTSIWDSNILWASLERVAFIVAITIPFDIRDISFDSAQALKTIATVLGTTKSKWLSGILLILASLLGIIAYFASDLSMPLVLSLILTNIVGIFAINRVNEHTGERYYAFCIEGLMILQVILFWTAKQL